MNRPLQGIGAALAQLDPDRIAWARAAAQRLTASGFDAAITPQRGEDAQLWYCSEQIAFAPQAPAPLRGAVADDLIAVLSAHETVLGTIEQALGLAAEFSTYGPLQEDVPIITLRREGSVLARLAILVALDPLPAPPPPEISRLACTAARLPLADAQRLTGGDLLVLAHGPWPLLAEDGGAFSAPGLPPLGYDPIGGKIIPILAQTTATASGASFPMSTSEAAAGLMVPVTVHLADMAVSQADLARLGETGTFDLGAVHEGLSVTLLIAGRRIGQGEIVRLGDRFAVLLDHAETPQPVADEVDMHDPVSADGDSE